MLYSIENSTDASLQSSITNIILNSSHASSPCLYKSLNLAYHFLLLIVLRGRASPELAARSSFPLLLSPHALPCPQNPRQYSSYTIAPCAKVSQSYSACSMQGKRRNCVQWRSRLQRTTQGA
jgi:hypothetical protein